jgi:hypothetical protein
MCAHVPRTERRQYNEKKYVNNNRTVNVQQIEISRYSVIGPNHAVHFSLQIIIIPYRPIGTIYNILYDARVHI